MKIHIISSTVDESQCHLFFFFWGMSLMTNIWLNDSAELAWCLFFVMSYNSCLASLPISLSYFSKTHDLFTYLHGFSYFWIFKFLNLLSLPIPFLDLESLDRPPNTPPTPPHGRPSGNIFNWIIHDTAIHLLGNNTMDIKFDNLSFPLWVSLMNLFSLVYLYKLYKNTYTSKKWSFKKLCINQRWK